MNGNEKAIKLRVAEIGGAMGAYIERDGKEPELYDDIQYNTYQYAPGSELAEHLIQTMADNGTSTFGFMVSLAEWPQRWTEPVWRYRDGENQYDFSQIDDRIAMTLRCCPEAKIIVRLFVGVDPAWLAEHPDERVVTMRADGSRSHRYDPTVIADPSLDYVSIASAPWREAAGEALAAAISHTEERYGDHVIAYCISGMSSEEWYHHGWHTASLDDYSPPMQNAFRAFVQRKYGGDPSRLQAAWGKGEDFAFDQVEIPAYHRRITELTSTFYRLPEEQDVVDFYLFYNEIIPETIESFARYAKRAAPDKLIGALYAYQLEFGEIVSGHHRLGRFLEIEEIDYILVETGYVRRHPSRGGDNVRNPFTSIRLHGKIDINDNDTATCRFDEIHPETPLRETYRQQLGVADTPEISGEVIKRITGFAMANGFLSTFFDLHGGYYDHPVILQKAAQAQEAYRKHLRMDRTSAAEILMVFDEKSDMHVRISPVDDNSGNTFLRTQLTVMSSSAVKLCAPFDAVLLQDLPRLDCSRYKILFFVNAYALTQEEYGWIEALKGGGRTLVFGYAPGLFLDEERDIRRVERLTGIHVEEGTRVAQTAYFFRPSSDPLGDALYRVTGREAETGLMSGYRYGEYSVALCPSLVGEKHCYAAPGAFATEMWADDPRVVPLAFQTLCDGREASAFACRRFSNYTTVYMNTMAVTSAVLRTLCEQAGVLLYSDREDTVFANASLAVVHAFGDGVRRITLPSPVRRAYDLVTGETLADSASFPLALQDGHTIYIGIER